FDEGVVDRPLVPLVHGEALARPVAARAEAAELARNRAARLRFPFPHMLEESLAPDLGALKALAFEVPLDDHLRSDPCVVGAHDPESILAPHPFAPGEYVLERVVERVADVERSRHVRRRHDDRPRLRIRALGPEQALALPMRVPEILDRAGFKRLGQVGHRRTRLAMRRCSINLAWAAPAPPG